MSRTAPHAFIKAMPNTLSAQDAPRALAEIDHALKQGRLVQALPLCQRLTTDVPQFADGWLAFARLRQMQGDYTAMEALARRAKAHSKGHPVAALLFIEALIHQGKIKDAKTELAALEKKAGHDAGLLARIAECYSQCGDFEQTVRLARKAWKTNPSDVAVLHLLTVALIAIGDMTEAETVFDQLIARAPQDFDAYYNRATLRKQTPAQNHVDEIKAAIATGEGAARGTVQLNYALAKELEDLGEYAESFAALKRGAGARRRQMAYKVDGDVQTMRALGQAFDADYFANAPVGHDETGPIFILGLPRSGTTLVDRIVSAHSDVESLGEIIEFALSLTTLCKAASGKAGLIEASKALNPAELGRAYMTRAQERGTGSAFFIDKTPANFLYIGLIATALPNARIVHVTRDKMDNAYAMYKTLFRMGYPFSYDFNDLAAYMKAKDALMAHWHNVLPGRIIDVSYEALVAEQETESRKLIDALGLEWQAACLAFHENKSPSATASAAQVRQPLYKTAVGRWRRYESELAPLAKLLGVAI